MNYRRESAFLIKASQAELDEAAIDSCRSLIQEDLSGFDWGFVFEQGSVHRVLPLIGRNLVRYSLISPVDDERLAFRHGNVFSSMYQSTRIRNVALFTELAELLSAFARIGVRVVVRKGPILATELYRDWGVRPMRDFDFFVEPVDVPRVVETLHRLGYRQGDPSADGRLVVPFSPAKAAVWKARVPNELPLVRPTSESFVEYYCVDICYNNFLPGSGFSLPAAGLDARSEETTVFGAPAMKLAPPEMLIDVACHLYKEATSFHYIRWAEDLNLIKFADIVGLCRAQTEDGWDALLGSAGRYGIHGPLYYSLALAEELYPGTVPPEVLEGLTTRRADSLDEFGRPDGEVLHWRNTLLSRLFDRGRACAVPPRAGWEPAEE